MPHRDTPRHPTLPTAAETMRMQAAILSEIRDAVVVADARSRITYWNDGATRLFGYSAEEMLGRTPDIIYPTDASDLAGRIGDEFIGDWRAVHKDGTDIWVRLRARPLLDEHGAAIGGIAVASDITERKERELELQRLATAVEQSTESIVIADAQARIVYVNPAFERQTGYRRDEVLGLNPRILKSGKQPPSFYRAMWSAIANGIPWAADMVNRRKDGSLFQEEATFTPITAPDGTITGYVAVKRDVTRERALEAAGTAAARERALIVEMMLLLPSGMSVEDTGHAVCQQILTLSGLTHAHLFLFGEDGAASPIGFAAVDGRAAPRQALPPERSRQLLERASRGPWIEDWVRRPDHPYDEVLAALDTQAAAYVPVHADGVLIGILIAGATHQPTSSATATLSTVLPGLIDLAEVAGALLDPTVRAGTEPARTRERILAVIEGRAFRPVFQPIVSLPPGRTVGFEALTRFDDGTPPDRMFADARRVGVLRELELATMAAAVTASEALPAGAFLSVNASPALILGRELPGVFVDRTRALVLEVTEHESIVAYDDLRAAMRELGSDVRLAADDTGAGVANFHHLIGLHPRYIKLDAGLVRGIDADPARQALAVALGHFAASTNAEVIAEGIETASELAMLRALGIGLGQGYFLGRPAPVASVGSAHEGTPRRPGRLRDHQTGRGGPSTHLMHR